MSQQASVQTEKVTTSHLESKHHENQRTFSPIKGPEIEFMKHYSKGEEEEEEEKGLVRALRTAAGSVSSSRRG